MRPCIRTSGGCPAGTASRARPPSRAAVRELREETGLRAERDLRLFARQELPELGRVKHYFCGATGAGQENVVLGEGAAILFVPADRVLDGRPYTPGTAEVLARFVGSPEHSRLATLAAARTGQRPIAG
ncbi:NUDIX domain-containing protein [Micromonospora sp. LZ34]